jgi:hypothetical protein
MPLAESEKLARSDQLLYPAAPARSSIVIEWDVILCLYEDVSRGDVARIEHHGPCLGVVRWQERCQQK